MNRRSDRVVVTAIDAIGHLRKAASNMGPSEMLEEIRLVFHPKREVHRNSEGEAVSRSIELGVWKRLSGEIRLLKDLGFTFCQLTGAVGDLSRQLPGWEDRKGIAKPRLPPCTCRYCA